MIPTFESDNKAINMAFRLAIGDFYSNITPFCDGLLTERKPVMLAGIGYDTPWTRDASINTWNCGGLLEPQVAKNTLLSVIINDNGKNRIGGEYWDAIIWAIGAYWYWLYNGDVAFRDFAADVIENSLAFFEDTEFDSRLNLFRGPACYGDGVAAYPDIYSTGESGIITFAEYKPELCADKGRGIPMHTLSTNCLYYEAYNIAYKLTNRQIYKEKADRMRDAINRHFWNPETGLYDYLVDNFGGCTSQEGLGQSFAIMFGVADQQQTASILENLYISKQGITCLYPNFERYAPYGLGRHCATVWPHIQAFWGDACAKLDAEKFEHELMTLTNNANRDGYFSEIYHPETGERIGGFQEWKQEISDIWNSEKRQMWCATGYIRMILFNLLGMKFTEEGIYLNPMKIKSVNKATLYGLKYRNMELDITVDFANPRTAFIPADGNGYMKIDLA